MAAATVADSRKGQVVGDRRESWAKLTTPADGDTWDTGLTKVEYATITMISTTIAAADAVGINSISGGVITFEVVGTARSIFVRAVGY